MRRSVPFPFLALLALSALPSALAGQIENCEFLPGTQNWTSRTSGNSSITYVSRPRIRCNDGRYIEADSAVSFSASGFTELIGRVYFQDASQSLRALRARYYDALRRLEADGEVVLTDRESGNVMTGERLLYLREMPGRPREELTMTGGRPTATLYTDEGEAADTAAAPGGEAPAPYDVVADRLYLLGDALFRAFGDVEVTRDSLDAQADSMDYDREAGVIDFAHEARLRQGEMDLRGQHVRLVLPGQVIQEIVATREATLLGEELDLEAHIIRLFFTDEALNRLVAVGERRALGGVDSTAAGAAAPDAAPGAARGLPTRQAPDAGAPGAGADSLTAENDETGRAVARAEGLIMTADSLDVLAPGEILERVVAVGTGRAVSTARDSLNTPDTPELVRSDWIEGDTVVAFLRPDGAPDVDVVADPEARLQADRPPEAGPPGSEGEAGQRSYVLERLVATVNARSLYRMDPDEDSVAAESPDQPAAQDTLVVTGDSLQVASTRRTLAVHYVEADRILIEFVDGAVDLMEVTGLRRGVYLEPRRGARTAVVAPPPGGRP